MNRQTIDIVLLDDDPDICTMTETVLQFAGMTVQTTNSPAGLNQLLQDYAPRVLLLDMLLGNTDGRDVCRSLRADDTNAGLYIVMMSGHSDAGESCKEAGADDFIEKPFDLDVLTAKLKKGMEPEADQVSSS